MSSVVREPSSRAQPIGALDSPAARSDGVALVHRTLAELCRSEIPLPAALRATADDVGGPLAKSLRAMAEDVASGASLGEAYAARAEAMPKLYRGLVEAGVAAGDLPGVLDEIAAHAEARADVDARLRRALAYPMLAAGFAVVVGVVLAVTIGPMIDGFCDEVTAGTGLHSSPAPGTLGGFLMSSWLPLALAATLVVLGGAAYVVVAKLRRPLDRCRGVTAIVFRWPVLGRLRLYATLSGLAASLAILLRRRTALPDAFALAASSCDEPRLRARFDKMAEAADAGTSLADALREGDVFSPSLLWTVDAAERRGEAADALDEVARIYRDRLSRAADRAALWVTPAAELFVGLLVLLVAVTFLGKLLALTRMIFEVQ